MMSFEQILQKLNALPEEEFRAFEDELWATEVPEDCEFSQIIERIGIEGTVKDWLDGASQGIR